MGLQNKFSDNDPYVQTAQTVSANNNQASLSAVIASNNYLSGSSVAGSSAVNKTIAAHFPIVNVAAENTIGAALGDIGQVPAAINQLPDGGGIP